MKKKIDLNGVMERASFANDAIDILEMVENARGMTRISFDEDGAWGAADVELNHCARHLRRVAKIMVQAVHREIADGYLVEGKESEANEP